MACDSFSMTAETRKEENNSLILLIVEFRERKDRGECEEEKHGIQKNESRYTQPGDI